MTTSRKKESFFIFVVAGLIFLAPYVGFSETEDVTVDSSPKNVGGLLFDFDEGVKVEQGPGGSVYVKSNKEYMAKKIRTIESKLVELDARVYALEERNKSGSQEENIAVAKADELVGATADGRRVLST